MIYQYLPFVKRAEMATGFPLCAKPSSKSGSFVSALLAILFSQLAWADSPEAAAETYLGAQLENFARQQNWREPRFEFQHQRIGSDSADCADGFQVSGASKDLLNRQRLTLLCASDQRSLNLVTQVTAYVKALHASQSIERGSPINASNSQLAELEMGRNQREFFSHPEQLKGLQARRRIRANQLLSANLVSSARLISRGEQVRIIASQDGINASTLGEALQNGSAGEVIRVRNISSDKTIDALVVESGTVTSIW